MGFLDKLFGRGKSKPRDEGIYFYVRCDHCGRVLHTRLDRQHDLATEGSGYVVRKEMMDDRCFRRITLRATFDGRKAVQTVEITGGTQIDRATWEAEKQLPRRVPPSISDGDL